MAVRPDALATTASGGSSSATGVASVVGFLVVLEFASGTLQGWLPPLLPSILDRYDVTAAQVNWVNGVHLLSTAECLPLLATLGDVYGHRRLLIVATTSVATGAALVALAPTFGVLLLGRVLEGPLMALLPLEFAIVRERSGQRAGRAIGLLIGALAIGGSLGALFSGVAHQYLSLSATLWIPAALLAVAVPVTVRLVPETTARRSGPVNWAAAGLLGVGLALVLAGVGNGSLWGWTSVRTVGAVAGGLAALAGWAAVEQRAALPFVGLPLVRHGGLGVPILAGTFAGAELFGSQAATSLFLGLPRSTGFGLGLGSGQIGVVLLVFGAGAFAGTVLTPRLVEIAGGRTVLGAGALLIAAGYLLTALVHDSVTAFVVWEAVLGTGNGMVLATLSTLVVTRAPADSVGSSAALLNTTRTVGGAGSAALFAALMSAMLTSATNTGRPVTSEAGYVTVWVVCAGMALAVAVMASWVRAPRPADASSLTDPAEASLEPWSPRRRGFSA